MPRPAELETCAIITTEENELCVRVHDRMPVILAPSDYERWLDTSDGDPADLLRPYSSDAMRAYPVSPRASSPKNDDADLMEALQSAGSQVRHENRRHGRPVPSMLVGANWIRPDRQPG